MTTPPSEPADTPALQIIDLPAPACAWCHRPLADGPWVTFGTSPIHVPCVQDYRIDTLESGMADLQSLVGVLMDQMLTRSDLRSTPRTHAPLTHAPE